MPLEMYMVSNISGIKVKDTQRGRRLPAVIANLSLNELKYWIPNSKSCVSWLLMRTTAGKCGLIPRIYPFVLSNFLVNPDSVFPSKKVQEAEERKVQADVTSQE